MAVWAPGATGGWGPGRRSELAPARAEGVSWPQHLRKAAWPRDPQYTPGTPEYEARIGELSEDPAHGGASNPKSVREAQVGLQLEADGQVGPLVRAPLDAAGADQGEFIDTSTGQRWDVKSSPDAIPSYGEGAGTPIRSPQTVGQFTRMINASLETGENVMLDPDGMSPGRLAQLQQVVADNPQGLGKVLWGS